MARGDHIYVGRRGYTHHGIDTGDGEVIHYTGEVGQKANAAVKKTSLAEFAKGNLIEVASYGVCNPVELVMERAESRLGESAYNLVFNNCEHFATWCKTGKHHSEQVKDGVSTSAAVAGGTATVAGGLGIVSAAGAAAGLSGPGVMSGLATVGGVVGGGAVTGIAIVGLAPAAVTTVAMRFVLRDDENLESDERDARRAGRVAAVTGAAIGTATAIGTVSATGAVAGVSAAGITSGLWAVGSAVGGGMTAGVAVTAAAPAVATAAVGYGAYRTWRWMRKRKSGRDQR